MTDTGDTTFEQTPTGIAIRTTITVADNPQPGTLGAALAALDGCGEALREALQEASELRQVVETAELRSAVRDAAELGAALRQARRQGGERLCTAAEAAGYVPTAYAAYEAGRRGERLFLSLTTWNRMLARYGLQLRILLCDDDGGAK